MIKRAFQTFTVILKTAAELARTVSRADAWRGLRIPAVLGSMLALCWVTPVEAQMLWTSPWGEATLYGSGELATYLEVETEIAGVEDAGFLYLLDAPTLPAVVESIQSSGGSAAAAAAHFSVEEGNERGLLLFGGIETLVEGPSATAGGGITAYLLIQVFDHPARIEFFELTSSLSSGFSPDAFSLSLYESDASGSKFGLPLLFFSGTYSGQAGAYEVSTPSYYLMELKVEAGLNFAEEADFFYRFDIVPVPEPPTWWLVAAGIGGILLRRRRRG